VLLDVSMPDMDGFQVARELRTREKTRLVPLIMVTALGQVQDRVQGLESGADDYIAKPVDKQELLARVQQALRMDHLRRQVDERQKLELILGDVSDGIVIVDAEARVRQVSSSARRLLQVDEGVRGASLESLWGTLEGSPRDLAAAIGRGEPRDFVLQRKDPTLFLAMSVRPVHGASGASSGAVVSLRNVTNVMQERRLQQDILSLVNHKFRTPLTVATLWTDVLLRGECGPLADQQREALLSVQAATHELGQLLDGMLSYVEWTRRLQKLERAPLRFRDAEIALRTRLTNVLRDGDDVVFERRVEAEVSVDATILTEALVELVRNAVKFAGERPVQVRILFDREPSTTADGVPGRSVITVADNGQGIPPEHQDRIFERFYQIEQDFTGQVQGLGLGLPMVKRAIEAMGGTLTVWSRLHEGTAFTIRI
jgi:signal transduction histidine kinase